MREFTNNKKKYREAREDPKAMSTTNGAVRGGKRATGKG